MGWTETAGWVLTGGATRRLIGRQFDDTPGGGIVDLAPHGHDPATEGTGNRFLQGEFVRDAYDTAIDYDGRLNGGEDRHDLFGPTVGSVGDALVYTRGEDVSDEERKARWWLYAVGAAIALYLLAPVFRLGTEVLDE